MSQIDVKEIKVEGLERELKVTIPASFLNTQLDIKIEEIKDTVQLKGFRAGKVPASHIKKTYGNQLRRDIIQELGKTETEKIIKGRDEQPAMQPELKVEGEFEPIITGNADLVFGLIYEVLPEIKLMDFKKLDLDRNVADIGEKDVDDALSNLAKSRKSFKARAKTAVSKNGDQVNMDYAGSVGGVAFDGGTAEGADLELGSGTFIPGFEEQLIGKKSGDKVDVKVTFPEEYHSTELAGKEAVFKVVVHEVRAPKEADIDDDLAKSFGMENIKLLKEAVSKQISDDYGKLSRDILKRDLLDVLNAQHEFKLSKKMIKIEFDQIWHKFEHELKGQGKNIDELDEPEETLREEYQGIAERRVRTGLVLAEVGRLNNIVVSEDEIKKAVMEQARQFPGKEQETIKYFQENPEALMQIRAPLFEEKAIDFIIEQANVNEKKMSIADLMNVSENIETKAAKKKPSAKKTKKVTTKTKK